MPALLMVARRTPSAYPATSSSTHHVSPLVYPAHLTRDSQICSGNIAIINNAFVYRQAIRSASRIRP